MSPSVGVTGDFRDVIQSLSPDGKACIGLGVNIVIRDFSKQLFEDQTGLMHNRGTFTTVFHS